MLDNGKSSRYYKRREYFPETQKRKVKKMKKQITIEIETEFSHEEIEQTVNELCAKGISKGCYQNYAALMEVLNIVSQAEMHYERTVAEK